MLLPQAGHPDFSLFRGDRFKENLILWTLCAVALITLCHNSRVFGQAEAPRSFESQGHQFITADAQRAIDRGLAYLSRSQNDDGSYGSGQHKSNVVAVTALSGMAFLSAGNVPGRGQYGKKVDLSVDFIVGCCSPSGFIRRENSEHGPMYGHGFATLFLAEVYGMSPKEEVKKTLKLATELIIHSQNKEGGWRYKPDGKDADVSVTVCQMMALRAARNSGIAVPKTTVDQCVEYVRKCQNVLDGGFRYQLSGNPTSEFPRSAAGVVVLYNAGITEGRDLERGLNYLTRSRPRGDPIHDPHYFYGQYYAVQAMWHAGGDHWRDWYPTIRDELVRRQLPDGGWVDLMISNDYATAMACLILQMPNNLLPIFQR